jgi:hypothetical protein
LVGLGALNHRPKGARDEDRVVAAARVVRALHDPNKSWAIAAEDVTDPGGAILDQFAASPAVGHAPRRVETLE